MANIRPGGEENWIGIDINSSNKTAGDSGRDHHFFFCPLSTESSLHKTWGDFFLAIAKEL